MTATKNAKGWAIWDHTHDDYWASLNGEVLWETKEMATTALDTDMPGYIGTGSQRFSVLFATITQNCEYPEEYL